METTRRVLITGGSSGIGLGLARRFAATGANVIITGRNQDRVDAVAAGIERVTGIAGDLSDPRDRVSLAVAVSEVDVLINNAGIQRRVGLAEDHAPWEERQRELDLLLAAPMHLTDLLLPAMLRRGRPATIVNVTSGGAFIPQPFAVGYSAAKAALHSYTLNLRHALADTPVHVVELIPPAVATGLSGLEHPPAPTSTTSATPPSPHDRPRHSRSGSAPPPTPSSPTGSSSSATASSTVQGDSQCPATEFN